MDSLVRVHQCSEPSNSDPYASYEHGNALARNSRDVGSAASRQYGHENDFSRRFRGGKDAAEDYAPSVSLSPYGDRAGPYHGGLHASNSGRQHADTGGRFGGRDIGDEIAEAGAGSKFAKLAESLSVCLADVELQCEMLRRKERAAIHEVCVCVCVCVNVCTYDVCV